MRLALLAGNDPARVAASRQIALGAAAEIVLSLVADRSSFAEHAHAMREAHPDVVLLVADRREAERAIDLAEALRLATDTQEPRPIVLLSADERMRARVEGSLGRPVEMFADVRLADARAAIVERLRAIVRGATGTTLRAEAIERSAVALAASSSRSTVVLDMTGSSTSLVFARPDGAIVAAHVPIGIGDNADRVVARSGLERVRRWLPRAVDSPALIDRVFNRAHWPDEVAAGGLALSIELALARECVARVLGEMTRADIDITAVRQPQSIVCCGRLATWRPSQTVLVALDALAPERATVVARETAGAPLASGGTSVETLALIAPVSVRRSATVRVRDATGTADERVGRGAFALMRTTGAVELSADGGTRATSDALMIGVVVDARGRPLELPPRDAERLPTIQRWYTALDALPAGEEP